MRCRAFRARSRCCCIEIEGRRANEERDSRSRSRDAPEESTTCSTSSLGTPTQGSATMAEPTSLARRPPGTRRTEYVFSLAELRGKSGKAQSKNSSFFPARYDATPGADVSISRYWVTPGRALCVVWRCHPRVATFAGHSDLSERSASLPLKPRAVLNGASTPGQAADANIVQLRLGAFRRASGA